MPREKMNALKASLLKFGFVMNLVVQAEGSTIIGGHQRLTAVREICKEKNWPMPDFTWAVILDVDDDTAMLLNVALNHIEGEDDAQKLGHLFQKVYPRLTPPDIQATGFRPEQVAEFRASVMPSEEPKAPEQQKLGSFAKSVTLTVEFDTVAERDKAKETLARYAKDRGVKAGALVTKMLAGLAANRPPPRTRK